MFLASDFTLKGILLMRHLAIVLGFVASLLVASTSVEAGVELPACFSDHMVLQRQQPIAIWGTDDPGTTVSVKLGDAHAEATADDQGSWRVDLTAHQAGGPQRHVIQES